LGHPKNYVLTPEELERYNELMQAAVVAIQKEAAAVRLNHRALTGKLLTFEGTPRCTTLAHVLEHLVSDGKHKLALMHFLNDAAKKRVEAREAELRG
jgi:predicted metalloprotease